MRRRRVEWSFLLCIVLFGGHALSFLMTRWSIGFRSRGEARHVRTLVAELVQSCVGPEVGADARGGAGYQH